MHSGLRVRLSLHLLLLLDRDRCNLPVTSQAFGREPGSGQGLGYVKTQPPLAPRGSPGGAEAAQGMLQGRPGPGLGAFPA